MVTNGLPLLSTTSPAPSRSPSFTSASDRDVAMDAEEESADDSDFLDADLDDPGDSSISLSITVPALATPKPNIVSTPWPYTSVNQSSPTLPATTPTSRYSMLIIPASSLPHEILLHILRLLPSTSLSPALLVCKAWCQCGVELLWHKPTFTSLPSLSRMLQVISSPDQTFPYPAFVRRLNFSALHGEMTDKTLRRLMPCIWLERLTLAGCKMLGSEGLITLLSQCERLVALDLSDVLAANDAVVETVARCCPKLQGLNLSGCKDVTDRGLEAIARACAGLKRIKLRHLENLTDLPIILLSLNCPLLLEVDLVYCHRLTSLCLLQLFRTSHHLRELSLAGCVEVQDDGFPSTQIITTLSNAHPYNMAENAIDIDHDELTPLVATDGSLVKRPVPLQAPPRLKPFDHLRYLDLTSLPHLTDDAVAGMVKYMPKIRNLVLTKCSLLSDNAIYSICQLGKHLHYLHLGHVSDITDAAVTALARSCTRLRYIDLACCQLLTDMSVFELASNLPRLKRIGLVRVANITDHAIYALFARTSLERIHLSYCENLTVRGIHELLSHLPRVTHLSLTGVPSFRRPDLQTWCRIPPSDFNTHQRATFCVYSGKGVHDLRRFLRAMHAEMALNEADGGSVTRGGGAGAGAGAGAARGGRQQPRQHHHPNPALQIPPHNPRPRQPRALPAPAHQPRRTAHSPNAGFLNQGTAALPPGPGRGASLQAAVAGRRSTPASQQIPIQFVPPPTMTTTARPPTTGPAATTTTTTTNAAGRGPITASGSGSTSRASAPPALFDNPYVGRPAPPPAPWPHPERSTDSIWLTPHDFEESTPPVASGSSSSPRTTNTNPNPNPNPVVGTNGWTWDPAHNTGSYAASMSRQVGPPRALNASTSASTPTQTDGRGTIAGSSRPIEVGRRPRGATVTRGNYRRDEDIDDPSDGDASFGSFGEEDVEMS